MKRFWSTGDRVQWKGGNGLWVYGTVVGYVEDLLKPEFNRTTFEDVVIICADKPVEYPSFVNERGDIQRYTGNKHGLLVQGGNLRKTKNPYQYYNLPSHLGVVAWEKFAHDGAVFRAGAIGKLLTTREDFVDDSVKVHWITGVDRELNSFRGDDGKMYSNCWNVPPVYLRWALIDPKRERMVRMWEHAPLLGGAPGKKFKPGEYVFLTEPGGLQASSDRHTQRIQPESILQIIHDRGGYYDALTVSGCQERAVGLNVQVRYNQVKPLPFAYLPAGTPVVIKADLIFRKRNLKGRTAVVVLPTDPDGDTGIELPDDLGAGSLDGRGKAGHCLYVPVKALEERSK